MPIVSTWGPAAMARSTDVLIVGGGVIGGAVAWSLARRGIGATVLEAGRIGRGASWASAGVLAPEWGAHDPPEVTRLAAAGLALWPDWAAELQERSGVALHFRRDGLLNLWVDPDTPGLPPELAVEEPPRGAGCERLTAEEARRLEPVLAGPIAGAVLDPAVAQVDNTRVAPALARAAADLGARVRPGTPVAGLARSGDRCTGVVLADGSTLSAGAVVVAAGAWSGALGASAGLRLSVEPWRGQMLTFEALDRPLSRLVFCGEMVLIPRPHGPLIVGTTLERVGFDARVTFDGLAHILARAAFLAPGLADLPLARTWAGLRPGTPDGLPRIGPVPGLDGLIAATGHGRKGIILAPITGERVAEAIVSGEWGAEMGAFRPGRGGGEG